MLAFAERSQRRALCPVMADQGKVPAADRPREAPVGSTRKAPNTLWGQGVSRGVDAAGPQNSSTPLALFASFSELRKKGEGIALFYGDGMRTPCKQESRHAKGAPRRGGASLLFRGWHAYATHAAPHGKQHFLFHHRGET